MCRTLCIRPYQSLLSCRPSPFLSLQLENLRGMLPFGDHSGGKLTVIKAGPGFHEEKSYDIGPDGEITEVKPVQMVEDACESSLSLPVFSSHLCIF